MNSKERYGSNTDKNISIIYNSINYLIDYYYIKLRTKIARNFNIVGAQRNGEKTGGYKY